MLDALVTIFIKIGFWVFSFLPPRSLPFVATFVGNILYSRLKRERSIIFYQLKMAFPEFEDEKLVKMGKESFLSFCLLVLESINCKKLLKTIKYPMDLTKEESGYFNFKDTCGVNDVLQSKSGAVCLVSHCGNFEMLAAFYIAKGIPLTVIAREPNYKTLIKVIEDFRASYGLDFLWREEMGNSIKLLKIIKTGKFLGTLIDQDTNLESIYTEFFGLTCAHPRGPISIAVRMNKPIFVANDARLPNGTHEILTDRIHWEHLKGKMSNDEIECYIVKKYSEQLEAHIRKFPTQWVWWHRRWRRIEGRDPSDPLKTEEYIDFLKKHISLNRMNA